MKVYKSTCIIVQQLVPYSIYLELGPKCWSLIDYRLVEMLDEIASHFKCDLRINNWHEVIRDRVKVKTHDTRTEYVKCVEEELSCDDVRQYNGFVPSWIRTDRKYSQQKFGRACKFKIDDQDMRVVAEMILDSQRTLGQFSHITFMAVDHNGYLEISTHQTGADKMLYYPNEVVDGQFE